MKRSVITILGFLLVLSLHAQGDAKQRLVNIFSEAEHSYLMDDYQQLDKCIRSYSDIFMANQDALGDSIDVFQAYYT